MNTISYSDFILNYYNGVYGDDIRLGQAFVNLIDHGFAPEDASSLYYEESNTICCTKIFHRIVKYNLDHNNLVLTDKEV